RDGLRAIPGLRRSVLRRVAIFLRERRARRHLGRPAPGTATLYCRRARRLFPVVLASRRADARDARLAYSPRRGHAAQGARSFSAGGSAATAVDSLGAGGS